MALRYDDDVLLFLYWEFMDIMANKEFMDIMADTSVSEFLIWYSIHTFPFSYNGRQQTTVYAYPS